MDTNARNQQLGVLIAAAMLILLSAFSPSPSDRQLQTLADNPRLEAFKVLQTKCNVCHVKKNRMMVFNEKNMIRRAARIQKAVFVTKRMPKGNEHTLTSEETTILKTWLDSQLNN